MLGRRCRAALWLWLWLAGAGASADELSFEWLNLSSLPASHRLCTGAPLHSLSVAHNQIARLAPGELACAGAELRLLDLSHNQLAWLEPDSLAGLSTLQVLLLDHNQLRALPEPALAPLGQLRHLSLAANRIEALGERAFGARAGRKLVSLSLRANPLAELHPRALLGLGRLKTLTLSQSELRGELAALEGVAELRFLYADRAAGVRALAAGWCARAPGLSGLVLSANSLARVPQLGADCNSLLLLDLSYNSIGPQLVASNLSGLAGLLDLYLSHNQLEWLSASSLSGLTNLQVLRLNANRLLLVQAGAFAPVRASLNQLDLSHNPRLAALDTTHLDRLEVFAGAGLPQLQVLGRLPSARSLILTYAYHCCDYDGRRASGTPPPAPGSPLAWLAAGLARLLGLERDPEPAGAPEVVGARTPAPADPNLTELVLWARSRRHLGRPAASRKQRRLARALASQLRRARAGAPPDERWHAQHQPQVALVAALVGQELSGWRGSAFRFRRETNLKQLDEKKLFLLDKHYHQKLQSSFEANSQQQLHEQELPPRCLPQPGPMQPCEDLFDLWWLRAGVWCVFPVALVGNALVVVVLAAGRRSGATSSALLSITWLTHTKRHIDVPRFLVINLAAADLLMSLYLALLATVDASTRGDFRRYAIKWQHSAGCQLAGFLAVLSSELSVFVLAVITLERQYAIANAVHLNRRLSLHQAALLMLLGYAFALAMALLPLRGVSDYRSVAICLPLEPALGPSTPLAGRLYLAGLLAINAFSFLLLLTCYLRMYCAIRGSQAWNSNDLLIAKRMSILVLADFACWSPLILLASGHLMGQTPAKLATLKLLTVFVLPLNSLANPFLYAITTKRFQRELQALGARLERALGYERRLAPSGGAPKRAGPLGGAFTAPGAAWCEPGADYRRYCGSRPASAAAAAAKTARQRSLDELSQGAGRAPRRARTRPGLARAHTEQCQCQCQPLTGAQAPLPAAPRIVLNASPPPPPAPSWAPRGQPPAAKPDEPRPASALGPAAGAAGHAHLRAVGSCDAFATSGAKRGESPGKLAASINRLLFEPVAQAWSSIQISIGGPGGGFPAQKGPGTRSASPSGAAVAAAAGAAVAAAAATGTATDTSTSNRMQLGERRMSRSCDFGLVRPPEPGLELSSTSGSGTADELGSLLAPAAASARPKCSRCRSWSPALLGRLEGCLWQLRARRALAASQARRHAQPGRAPAVSRTRSDPSAPEPGRAHTATPSDELSSSSAEPKLAAEAGAAAPGPSASTTAEPASSPGGEPADDQFDPNLRPGSLSAAMRRKRHFRRQRHSASVTSDTLSTRTAASLLLTASASIDSESNIPLVEPPQPQPSSMLAKHSDT